MASSGPPTSSRPSSSLPSSRTKTFGGRVQRDVRLQAALALIVGIALVAVPLFIWGRGRNKSAAAAPSTSTSISSEDAGPPTVIFGDAGATLSIDAGGRPISFGEPRYLKCQNPGPGTTAPDKCDHLGMVEDAVTKAIAERASTCIPTLTSAMTINVVVDVSFKKKKMRVKAGKDGSTMPASMRTKAISCIEKGLVAPSFDAIAHAHQRYLLQFVITVGGGAQPSATIPPPPGPTIPP